MYAVRVVAVGWGRECLLRVRAWLRLNALLINCSGTFTLAATAAATLGNGWWCYVRDTGTGVITLDPNASEALFLSKSKLHQK